MNILMLYPSWEERSALGFKRDIESAPFDKVILFENANPIHSERIVAVVEEIIGICRSKNIECCKVPLEFGQKTLWNSLEDLIGSCHSDDHVKIDICTMSRNLIWVLLFFLKEKVQDVGIVYHQPLNYSNEWLSRDADLPRLLFKHSGLISIDKQTLLVIVTGFDSERTKQLVYFYNPSKVILLIQEPNKFDGNVRNTPRIHADECMNLGVKTDYKMIDCYSGDWGYGVLEGVVSENLANYNIIVSSLGPKLSAVSVYRTFLEHPEIALTYIPCKDYNVNYCQGIGDSLEYNFHFGKKF